MSSGLQRRRVAGSSSNNQNSGNTNDSSDYQDGGSIGNQVTRNGYTEDGRKIAYDPDDINNTAEELKQPKLTLMEEVLLLGLNDKLVWPLIFLYRPDSI